jgi:hypothetical protein
MPFDLQADIQASAALVAKIKSRDDYAQNLYAALCNMQWQKTEVMPILKDELWTCSWRAAGGIVAELRGEGDYLDWYCSGMGGLADYDYEEGERVMSLKKYVTESTVTDEIRQDLRQIGWHPVPYDD